MRGQDGWILATFVIPSLWTDKESRSINSQERKRLISSNFDRTSLVNKGFLIWRSGKFFLRDMTGIPERAS